jgi:hypothetical protein
MAYSREWEDFYTESKNNEDLCDYININTKKKQYILYVDADIEITDSVDENDNYHFAEETSREIFDIIVSGVKEKGYTRLVPTIESADD